MFLCLLFFLSFQVVLDGIPTSGPGADRRSPVLDTFLYRYLLVYELFLSVVVVVVVIYVYICTCIVRVSLARN